MSTTAQRPNFDIKSDLFMVQTRDYPLADTTLLDPRLSTCLVDGEWVRLTDARLLVRATNVASAGDPATVKSFPLWNEPGRSDTQAIRKMTGIRFGSWEADTRIFDAAAVVGGGAAITAMDQPLKVATITLGGRNYSGLVGAGASDIIVARVSKLPANNGGRLGIVAVAP
jgi:hypothetical protein